jgi:siroheme synthase
VATLPEIARAEGVKPPALIVIGEVVRVREALASFAGTAATAPAMLAA